MKLSSLRARVRQRPAMFWGDVEQGAAACHVVMELVANSIDQFLMGKVSQIHVNLDKDYIVVRDDGPGLPFGQKSSLNSDRSLAEDFLEIHHLAANADGHAPHVHYRFSGLGLAVINASSKELYIESDDGLQLCRHHYSKASPAGVPLYDESTGKVFSEFRLQLDGSIFNRTMPDLEILQHEIAMQVFHYPGLQISLNGNQYLATNGLLDLARLSASHSNPASEYWINSECDQFALQVALIDDSSDTDITMSWVNGVESSAGGSHLDGLNDALEQVQLNPTIRMIHIIMQKPEFAGPTKSKLVVPGLAKRVSDAIADHLIARK